jgi:hypothetical protein
MEIFKVSTGLARDQQGQFWVALIEFSEYVVSHKGSPFRVLGSRVQALGVQLLLESFYQIPFLILYNL